MKNIICIIDYGCGNTRSIQSSINFLGYKALISNDNKIIKKSSHIILPGVGSYFNALEKVKLNLDLNFLKEEILKKKKPILGICVGMQILSTYGYEFKKTIGLNWISGNVVKMKNKPNIIPQVGWNNLKIFSKNNKLLEKINYQDYFYFLHSFKFNVKNKKNVIAYTEYNEKFSSIINKENIIGVQFHPEKSQTSGLKLLKNFIENFK
tara:strand:- start:1785 stop:2408 length:624 start_codon:yes stop_codon:yes gene_type:complete